MPLAPLAQVLGIAAVNLTPSVPLANVMCSFFFGFWNLLSGERADADARAVAPLRHAALAPRATPLLLPQQQQPAPWPPHALQASSSQSLPCLDTG